MTKLERLKWPSAICEIWTPTFCSGTKYYELHEVAEQLHCIPAADEGLSLQLQVSLLGSGPEIQKCTQERAIIKPITSGAAAAAVPFSSAAITPTLTSVSDAGDSSHDPVATAANLASVTLNGSDISHLDEKTPACDFEVAQFLVVANSVAGLLTGGDRSPV